MSRDLYSPTPVVGVAVLVERDGAILLVKRGTPPKAGRWSLPGGHVEVGEPVREAARREVAEECHIDIEVLDVVDVCDLIRRDRQGQVRYHYALVGFLGKYLGGTASPGSDAREVAWVPIGRLAQYKLTATVRAVVDKGLTLLTDRGIVPVGARVSPHGNSRV